MYFYADLAVLWFSSSQNILLLIGFVQIHHKA